MAHKSDIAGGAAPPKAAASAPTELERAFSLPSEFKIAAVPTLATPRLRLALAPSLGPLAAFTGDFTGNGFNTIFRPDSQSTPTPMPNVPHGPDDNVLELNLTRETLSFSPSLGSVPNRGSGDQSDAFLNGVPYLQSISDVTNPAQPVGIHLEPGLWVIVPITTDPAETVSVVRMASIPHGTTICAQGPGPFSKIDGPPSIPPVDIRPFTIGAPADRLGADVFPSLNAADEATRRIPQDLTSFVRAGTITQAMLDDPNTVLRNAIAEQRIVSTTTITVDTDAVGPLLGGGTDNIAFLQGNTGPRGPNARSVKMQATFWIETVEHTIIVPPHPLGGPPLTLRPQDAHRDAPGPVFSVLPPVAVGAPRPIKIQTMQIQYSQLVLLDFATLSWPHVSVATLVPAHPIVVPPSAWS